MNAKESLAIGRFAKACVRYFLCSILFLSTAIGFAQVSLPEALDNNTLLWSSTGDDARWVGQTASTHDGQDAAQSGFALFTPSLLQTQVLGPGTLSFWWKSSAASSFYAVYLDNAESPEQPGTAWKQVNMPVPDGTHYITWVVDMGAAIERIWVDQVTYNASVGNRPGFTQSDDFLSVYGSGNTIQVGPALPKIQTSVGSSFTIAIAATNNPTSFRASGLPPDLTLNSETGTISGIVRQSGTFPAQLTATNSFGPGAPGILTFSVEPSLAPPNDNFLTAQLLTGSSGTVKGTNLHATRETGEPAHYSDGGNYTGGTTVWYQWTTPVSGITTIDTLNSDFDTILAVYTGNALSQLTLIDNNDQGPYEEYQSLVTFYAVAGTVYHIAVDGYSAAAGNITLHYLNSNRRGPANDHFANAQILTGISGTVTGTNVDATKEPGEPSHYSTFTPGGPSVWFRWTPAFSGDATIDTLTSSFDTLLAVYTGDALDQLTLIASNDDQKAPEVRQSLVTFPADAGTVYRIAVDGWARHTGNLTLHYSLAGAPPSPDISLTGTLSFGDVNVGSSAQRTLLIKNIGGGTLNVTNISYPAGFSGPFQGSIPAGGSQNVTVTFEPKAALAYSGSLTVTSNAPAGPALWPVSGNGVTASAKQVSSGYQSPGTATVQCVFEYPNTATLSRLIWIPELPAGWSLDSVSGDGSPTTSGLAINFTDFVLPNPVKFAYTVTVPPGVLGDQAILGRVQYRISGDPGVREIRATPDPLKVGALLSYHSADYTHDWKIDDLEVSLVLDYWRSGAYHAAPVDPVNSPDGFAPEAGPTGSRYHSADYLDPRWQIDIQELLRVQRYWRAGGYHVAPVDPINSPDGFATGLPSRSIRKVTRALDEISPATFKHTATNNTYTSGGTLNVSTRLDYSGSLEELGWRLTVPSGWRVTSVSGSGKFVLSNDGTQIVCTDFRLPSSPVLMQYTVLAPPGASGKQSLRTQVVYAQGGANTTTAFAEPDPFEVSDSVPLPVLTSVTIGSSNNNAAFAKAGDILTLRFTASTAIQTPTVTLAGRGAVVENISSLLWSGSVSIAAEDKQGMAAFSIDFMDLASNKGIPVSTTTDASSVTIDTLHPALSLPPDQTAEATSNKGAIVNYPPATATDLPPFQPRLVESLTSQAGFYRWSRSSLAAQARNQNGLSPLAYSRAEDGVFSTWLNQKPAAFGERGLNEPIISYSHPSGSMFPLGLTEVSVTATDAAGNPNSGKFNVLVVDTTPPAIALNGGYLVRIGMGSVYTDAGATALDLVDGPVGVTSSSDLDVNVPGRYYVLYTATDTRGNTAILARIVVVSSEAPMPVTTLHFAQNGGVPYAGEDTRIPSGAVWSGFGVPAINDAGMVAVIGRWKSPTGEGAGIFVDDYLVVMKGEPVPGVAGATWTKFEDPVLAEDGSIAFVADIGGTAASRAGQDRVVARAGYFETPVAVARTANIAPGTGGAKFREFVDVSLDGPSLVFTARLRKGSGVPQVDPQNDYAIWSIDPMNANTLVLALRRGQEIQLSTGGTSTLKSFVFLPEKRGAAGMGGGNHTWDGTETNIRFTAVLADGRSAQMTVVPGGFPAAFSESDDGVGKPGLEGAQFGEYGPLSSDHGGYRQAFQATLKPGLGGVTQEDKQGLFLFNPETGTFDPVIRQGQAAPGTSGVFKKFHKPVFASDGSALAWVGLVAGGTVVGSDDTGIWWKREAATPALVAREGGAVGSTVPDAKWNRFDSLGLPGGEQGPIFVGRMESGSARYPGPGGVTNATQRGVWAMDANRVLQLLFREGVTQVDGKTVKTFTAMQPVSISPGVARSFNASSTVVWRAIFSDGSTAILTTEMP